MEEDTEGLKTLIKQRNQRPCYARTISLEFSCTDHSNPVSTQRKRRLSKKNSRKKSNEMSDQSAGSENELDDIQSLADSLGDCTLNLETNEAKDIWCGSSSSSDSEYYSANESPNSDTFSDGSTSQIRDNLSELDFLLYSDSGNTSSDSDSDSAFCSVNSSQHVPIKEKVRERQFSQSNQRAPSKKQKRKKRLRSKITYLNSLPFSGLENFECCISDVKNDITESVDQIPVMKSVPSLSDLCLLAAKNLGTKNTQTNVPYKIRQIFKESGVKKNLQKFQLSSMYRHLTYCEQKDLFEQNYLYTSERNEDSHQSKVLIPRRNIWDGSLNFHIFKIPGYNGSVPTCYIPYTHCSHDRYVHPHDSYYWDLFMISRHCLSVYATTVDLMMPPVVKLPRQRKRQPSGKGQQQTEQDTTQIIKNLTFRLKTVLNERFPKSSKHYFDLVLPYVFWARGDIGYAAAAFTDLAEKETRSRMKAMYLFEIGRMYSQLDDPDNAKSCFRLAADAALSKSKLSHNDEKTIHQINRQTLMLTANAYDQGLMTAEKALLAFGNWKAGVTSPLSDSLVCDGIWSCMDSLLCYHAWSLENGGCTSGFLEEAKTRISSLTKSHPEVYYHLSMVCALEGNAQECSEAYKCFNYTARGTDGVGSEMVDLNPRVMKHRSPWNILIDHVKGSTTVKPLQVVWRTQLGPLIVRDKRETWESDMHNKAINLRLSSEGYITGDMQMALPPMRGVYLDPYTGYMCFPHIPGDTETWIGPQTDVLNDSDKRSKESNLVVPTPTELYRDNSGNVVHLMCPSMFQAMMNRSSNISAQHMVLTWTGSDGQHARFNLMSKLRQMIYDEFTSSLNYDCKIHGKNIPKWTEIMTKLAQRCVSKGFYLDKLDLRNYVNRHWGKKAKSKVKQQTEKKSKTSVKQFEPFKSYEGSPTILLLGQVVVFSTNLCIPVSIDNRLYLVFIECSNRTDFLNPVIVKYDAGWLQITQHPEFPQVLKRNRLPHADVMYCEVDSGSYKVYNKFGEEVDYIKGSSNVTDDVITLPVIVDGNKICFLDNKSVRSVCNAEEEWAVHLGQVNKLKNIHNILVLLTETGIKFADGRSFQPLCVFSDDGRCLSLPISDDSMEIQGAFKYFSILHEELLTDDGTNEKYTRAVVALDNHLVILKLSEEEDVDCIKVLLSIALPGHAKEICFIGGNGFLVTVTQHITSTQHYRENLYYFDMNGRLKNYLLCLGHGPRSFLPVYLPGNADLQESQSNFGKQGWHVYMKDGHDGIICVYLHP